jgi:hypothetical protein
MSDNENDELFGRSDSDEEMENSDNSHSDKDQEDQINSNLNKDSDVDEKDQYLEDDFFNEIETNESSESEYKKASPFPVVKCPGEKILESYDKGYKKSDKFDKSTHPSSEQPMYYQFRFVNEKIISLENREFERDTSLIDINADYILQNYSISYSLKFDYSLSKYDNFSKRHHREKLYKLINDIDWDNEYKIRLLKKEVNPYEEVFENFFDRRSSYKFANLNSLFKFNLFNIDYIVGFTPILIIGDDGGYSDYAMWHAHNCDFIVKILSVPERGNKIFKTNYRKEIDESKDQLMNIMSLQKGCDIDEIENFNSEKINEFVEDVMSNTEGIGVSLYMARKFLKFKKEFNSEIKYKKFLLLNTILALSTLSKGGNCVIKIYDMFTQFTISVLFILFNSFEKFTIVKPFSTRPNSASRFVICQKLIEFKPKILNYLIELYDKYTEALQQGRDIDFVYPISKIIKDENFTNYMMELNSLITEQRIESLESIKNAFESGNAPKFDKMDIKKKCLDLWKIPVLHFDPRQVISNKNTFDLNSKFNKGKTVNKISSIQDKDALKMYSEYDKYTDGLKSMIDMWGGGQSGKTPASNGDRDSRDRRKNNNDQEMDYDKKSSINNFPISGDLFNKGKKMSSTNKLDQLKQKIIADRKTESFLKEGNVSSSSSHHQRPEDNEEFLRKKREMLMSSFVPSKNKSSSSTDKKSSDNSGKGSKSLSSKIKVPLQHDERFDIRIPNFKKEGANSLASSSLDPTKDMLRKKEQIVEESMRNRQLQESKKTALDDRLKAELEKYKKK